MKEQGKYPVIYLDLKETRDFSYERIENEIIGGIQDTYTKHSYLAN